MQNAYYNIHVLLFMPKYRVLSKHRGYSMLRIRLSVTKAIDFVIFCYIESIYIFSFTTGDIVSKCIALVLMLLLLFYALRQKKFVLTCFAKIFAAFTSFCLISVIWSYDKSAALIKCFTLVQLMIMFILLYNYVKKNNKVRYVIWTLCVTGTLFAIYIVHYYGLSAYIYGITHGLRMGRDITNVNKIGMILSITALIGVWYVYYEKRKAAWFTIIICVLVSFGTGSKTVILSLLIGIFTFFALKAEGIKKIKSVVQAILLITLLYNLMRLPAFDLIRHRMDYLMMLFINYGETDSSTVARLELIKAGLNAFFERPFTGVGIGNGIYIAQAAVGKLYYLHNNYVEMLASLGLFGTIIYYTWYIFPLRRLWIRSKKERDSIACLVMTMLVVKIFMQIGTIAYTDKLSYIIIMLFFITAEEIKTKRRRIRLL